MIKIQALISPKRFSRKGDSVLSIKWSDGVISDFNLYELRVNCPCADCVNELTGVRILDENTVDNNVRPFKVFSVGRYALGIKWTDNHESGIYSYDYLRRLSGQN